jgi:hypothetical protein
MLKTAGAVGSRYSFQLLRDERILHPKYSSQLKNQAPYVAVNTTVQISPFLKTRTSAPIARSLKVGSASSVKRQTLPSQLTVQTEAALAQHLKQVLLVPAAKTSSLPEHSTNATLESAMPVGNKDSHILTNKKSVESLFIENGRVPAIQKL